MHLSKILVVCCLLLSACSDQKVRLPGNIQGKVIAVKDGDTIEILFEGKPLRIRFEHIDCPEIKGNQPFGKLAKQFTSSMCFGQVVTILHKNRFDRYRRLIGVVINDKEQNVNKELLKAGLAWHFKKYSNNQDYAELEINARENHIGLWVEEHPIAPWEWRGH